jgi:hypothetical protein
MKVNYLTKVLQPLSSPVHLQPSIQNHTFFPTVLWGNQDEFVNVDREIIVDEFLNDTPAAASFETMSEPMDVKEPGIEQETESNGYLPKPTVDENREVLKSISSTKDDAFPIPKKEDIHLHHATTQLNNDEPHVKKREKEVKEDESGRQESDDIINIEKPKLKGFLLKESNHIPAVDVDDQHEITVPETNKPKLKEPTFQRQKSPGEIQPQPPKPGIAESSTGKVQIPPGVTGQEKAHEPVTIVKTIEVPKKSAGQQDLFTHIFIKSPKKSGLQPQQRKTTIDEPKKEKRPVPPVITKQEKVYEKETMVKTIEVPIKPTGQQDDTLQKQKSPQQIQPQPQKPGMDEPRKEKRPGPPVITKQEKETIVKTIEVPKKSNDWQALKTHLFTIPPNKNEAQMAKMAKEIALINKKLDEHGSSEPPAPLEPVFLPKRPASRNLGGWTGLERSYNR